MTEDRIELERRVAELLAERDRYRAVLEGMQEGVLDLDGDLRLRHVNGAALLMLGLSEPPLGRTLLETIRSPALHELATRAIDGPPATAEIDFPGEPPRHFLARATSRSSGDGVVLVIHDTTEVKRLQTVRKDFVANVSHELRTPVSVILANTETLLDGALEDSDRARVFLDGLRRNAERLSNLITDLLEISRIDSGRRDMLIEPLLLHEEIHSCLASVAAAAAEKNIHIEAETQPGLTACASERALRQILLNLIDNAIKYTQPGGHVEVRTQAVGEWVRVAVCDDGPGVEPSHRERIFERFYRVDKGRSRAVGGTGLGLAIVKNLVEIMGGRVGVDEREPRGAAFWFTLKRRDDAICGEPNGVSGSARERLSKPKPEPATVRARSRTSPDAQRSASLTWDEPQEPDGAGAEPPYMKELRELRQRLLLMVGRVELMITQALRALESRDAELGRRTIEEDGRVNLSEIEIDDLCFRILSDNQVIATEHVRFVTLALKMVTDLERIGDLAVNICERAIDLSTEAPVGSFQDFQRMARLAQSMIQDAFDAFVDGDEDKAWNVIERDDEVDTIYGRVFRRLLASMIDDPKAIERGIHLLSVAKWLERMADHCTNLAEDVIGMLRGEDIRHPGKLDVR